MLAVVASDLSTSNTAPFFAVLLLEPPVPPATAAAAAAVVVEALALFPEDESSSGRDNFAWLPWDLRRLANPFFLSLDSTIEDEEVVPLLLPAADSSLLTTEESEALSASLSLLSSSLSQEAASAHPPLARLLLAIAEPLSLTGNYHQNNQHNL
jgi:hypothetical protein